MNDDDLVKLEQNVFRESMKDGITELFGALVFVIAPVMFYNPAFIAIFAGLYIIVLPQLIETIRQKYTYPRLGYVKLRTTESDMDVKPFAALVFVTILATGIATLIFTDDVFNFYNWITMFPIAFGMIMLAPSAYLVEKSGSRQYWLLGTFTSILGFVVVTLTAIYPPTDAYDGILAFSVIIAIVLIVVGIVKFLHFTRKYPVLDLPEDAKSEQ